MLLSMTTIVFDNLSNSDQEIKQMFYPVHLPCLLYAIYNSLRREPGDVSAPIECPFSLQIYNVKKLKNKTMNSH